jgi:thiamine-monophosphate kinase
MSEKKTTITPVSEFGEFGLIELMTKNIQLKNSNIIKGVGDDAAIVKSNEKNLVYTTDMLLEGVHFDLIYVPLKHLGYKVLAVNVSDIYAMNATPKSILLSLGVSANFQWRLFGICTKEYIWLAKNIMSI